MVTRKSMIVSSRFFQPEQFFLNAKSRYGFTIAFMCKTVDFFCQK